jgi:ComF family protein
VHWSDLAELLAPARCGGCGRTGPDRLCEACLDSLTRSREDHDPEGEGQYGPLPAFEAQPLCAKVQSTEPGRGSPLFATWAAFAYAGPILGWMHRFKYPPGGLAGLDPEPGALVRALILESVRDRSGPRPDAIVPVPLHTRRLRARGFNPAALLARALAQQVGAPLVTGWLVRHRDTPRQTGLGRAERSRNVAGAFSCRRRRGRSPAHVWLVDDVVTTGATLHAAAEALGRAGAGRVVAVCAARTPAPQGGGTTRDEEQGAAPDRRGAHLLAPMATSSAG